MPNYTDTNFVVVLPRDKKDKFLSYFSDWDNPESKPVSDIMLARTWLNSCTEKESGPGLIELDIVCTCAWSIISCWIDGYPQERPGDRRTMEQVCLECDVVSLEGQSIEEGLGFREEFSWKHEEKVFWYECHDLQGEEDDD